MAGELGGGGDGGSGCEATAMELDHIVPHDQLMDPVKNGTHLGSLDCSPAFILIFICLLDLENITDWRRNNKAREKLCLVCKSWDRLLRAQVVHLSVSPTNQALIFNNIYSFPSIHTLNAYGSIGDLGVQLFSNIPQPTTFKTLDFSVNSIGEEGALFLANALSKNFNLMKLDISDNPIGDAGGVQILKALEGKPLERLILSDCSLDNDSLAYFGNMAPTCQLRSLDWSYNTVNYLSAASLAVGLKSNTTLTKLKMRDCDLAGYSALAIGELMKVHPAIATLDISGNEFADGATKFLAESLVLNPKVHLTKLLLTGNSITEGVGALGAMLIENRTLTYLDLSMNLFGEYSEMITFADGVAKNASLKTLLLNSTNIGDSYSRNIGNALRENKSLTTLDISNNAIESKVKEIAFALQTNTHLTSLNISKNKLEEKEVLELVLSLKDNTALTSLNISRCKLPSNATEAVRQACKKVQMIGDRTMEPLKPRVRV